MISCGECIYRVHVHACTRLVLSTVVSPYTTRPVKWFQLVNQLAGIVFKPRVGRLNKQNQGTYERLAPPLHLALSKGRVQNNQLISIISTVECYVLKHLHTG